MKILIAAVAALLVISCNSRQKFSLKDVAVSESNSAVERKPTLADNAIANESAGTDTTASPQLPQKQNQPQKNLPEQKIDWDKKIIKTALLNAEVRNYDSFYSSLREKVRNIGGYIAQEEQNQSDYKIENSITIKVPVDQFDNAVTLLTNGTDKVNERKITSQDVTTEIVDTKSRMEAKKQVRERYIDFLKQAKNMSEVLSVQSEINGIQEEIESAAGRINYMSHASSFSTINFTFYQVLNITAKDNTEPSFWTKIRTSFKTGWQWTGDIIIGLVSIWPVILFFAGIWIIIKRYSKSKVKHV
jgi:uncharacterized protein DUF4349